MNIILAGKFKWNKKDIDLISRNGRDNVFVCPNEELPIPIAHNKVDAIFGNWFFKYHDLCEFTKLKYIQLLSAGYNGINPDEVRKQGIILHNAKDVYSIPISEFTIGNILLFFKNGYFFYQNKENHRWAKRRNLEELYNKKVLIIGTGSIGREIAIRVRAFTQYVYGCNRTERKSDLYCKVYPLGELIDIVSEMDVIILTIALTDNTTHLINSNVISKMKKNALIVNVSRGEIIDESALIEALKNHVIEGAILDVFEQEPLDESSPLWQLENAIITPHNAFESSRNNERLRGVVLNNYESWKVDNE